MFVILQLALARTYYYMGIPSLYVFKVVTENGVTVSRWTPRKSHYNCIGKMFSVSPSQLELFRLRLLLLNVKGAKCYNDLKTVEGVQYSTFTEACIALGLIENDAEWDRAMQEAVSWMMPCSLRPLCSYFNTLRTYVSREIMGKI